jgi:hypothetical protein
MSYRAGFGPRIDARGIGGAPHVLCDHPGCTAVFEAKEGRGVGPPAWLRKNIAPPGWRLERDGVVRRDFCPAHNVKPTTPTRRR